MPQKPPNWFKSTYSGAPNNECLECAQMPRIVLVRDSKNCDGPFVTFSARAWARFTRAVADTDLPQR
ncbi:DUF397 domain-containing protein [Streptomyces lushanensis]|uniref:DUF397 domain-containing protein n=1 Tax=Streptomyces lushanensis TaxID=1434255 RepID=UPI00099F9674|nr:DUF397 domain-containing protein [Streptomyces lushanensis]